MMSGSWNCRTHLCFGVLLASCGASGGASALTQEGVLQTLLSRDIESLLEISVTTVSKTPERAQLAPGTVYVITAEQINRNGWRFLQDALQSVPSLYLYDPHAWVWGGQRGLVSNFSQTLLLINGREVNNLIASEAFISRQFSTHNIERIEVMASPASALYGANALAGVINIITFDGDPDYAGSEVTLDYGSFDSRGLSFVFAQRWGAWRISGSGMAYASDEEDFSAFVGDRENFSSGWVDNDLAAGAIDGYENPSASLPLNLQIDYQDYYLGINYYRNRQSQGLEKLRWDYTSGEDNREMALYYGGARFRLGGDKDLKVEYQHTRSTLWGRYTAGHDPVARLQAPDDIDLFTFAATDSVDPALSFAQNLANNGYIDPSNITAADIETYFTHLYSNKSSHGSTRNRLELQFDWRITAATGLIAGYTYDAIDYIGLAVTDAATGIGASDAIPLDTSKRQPSYDSVKHGLFTQLKSELLAERFWLTAGVRADRQNHYGSSVNPRLGLVWQVQRGRILKLLYGEAFREPNVFELASDPGVGPAKLRSYEVNYSQPLLANSQAFVAAYHNRVTDFLGSVGSVIGSGIAQVDEQRVTGLEFRLDARSGSWLGVVSGSWIIDGEQRSGGERAELLSIPKRRLAAGLNYLFASGINANLTYGYTAAYDALSGNKDLDEIFVIESAHRLDATVSVAGIALFGQRIDGFLTLTNLTDAEIYQANVRRSGPQKFLQDGRAAYVRVAIRWP